MTNYKINLYKLLIISLAFYFVSCASSSNNLVNDNLLRQETEYSVIFLIHGDGDYLYHTKNGEKLNADEVTFAKAKSLARKLNRGEVFIYYYKRNKISLPFSSAKDEEILIFKNGVPALKTSLERDENFSSLKEEADLFNRYSTVKPAGKEIFLYFGHQIPEFDGRGYNESYPKLNFTADSLTKGFNRFLSNNKKFDLTILSTCSNGTPGIVNILSPYTKFIIASPELLHLSYFDFSKLNLLQENINDSTLANAVAKSSFEHLKQKTETIISAVVYDVKKVMPYVKEVYKNYSTYIKNLEKITEPEIEYFDCGEDSLFKKENISEGVTIFYRPPMFGKNANKKSHSGWECMRQAKPKTTAEK